MIKHLSIDIFGRVQNVSFRAYTQREADRLNLNGSVSNSPDGSVHIEVEGEESQLDEFIKWCRNGPKHAQVKKIEKEFNDVQNMQGFIIK